LNKVDKDSKPIAKTAPENLEKSVRVAPDVYIATLLDEANEHLLELKDLLKNQEGLPKKSVPYNTGEISISAPLRTKPADPSGYTFTENVYAKNNNKPLEKGHLINGGIGRIFFIVYENSQTFSDQEEVLNPGEHRVLYNIFEIRLRVDQPFTRFRFVENDLFSGSLAPLYKNSFENRIVLQPNEASLTLGILFDTDINPVTVTAPPAPILVPDPGPFPTNNALFMRQNPLGPGLTAAFIVNGIFSRFFSNDGLDPALLAILNTTPPPFMMPFTIPAGFVVEGFVITHSFSTDFTLRDWVELVPGTGVYTVIQTFVTSKRGFGFNAEFNLNFISTQFLDPDGAPAPGRKFIFTITNDDTVNSMSGTSDFELVLRKLRDVP
jgi:hypothetical protein